MLIQTGKISVPIERWSRIGFPSRRNIAMAGNSLFGNTWKEIGDLLGCQNKLVILLVGVRDIVASLELYANREIVAPHAALETGFTSMPCALTERNILQEFAIAPDQ